MNSAQDLLFWNALALVAYMLIAFVVAYRRKRLDTVDVAWGGGFVVVAWLVAGLEPNVRTVLIALLVDVWAIRLTSHILERSRKTDSDDQRYVALAAKWSKKYYWPRAFISIFLLQGLLVLIISLPSVFAAGDSVPGATIFAVVGALLWGIGFVIEAISDYQLKKFSITKANKGKVLDSGLWRYTRHPNYLGEIIQWYGIGVIACGASFGWIGLVGPVALNVLIRFVSGVPPIEKRKQKDPAYRAYMQRTNALLPRLRRDF